MDLWHEWAQLGIWPKLAFMWVLLAVAVTTVRGCRLWWWSRWSRRVAAGAAADAATIRARCGRARTLVRSTRGLATAAVWLTGSGASIGLVGASHVIGLSSRSMAAIIAEDALAVIDLTAVALGLCALLFAAAWLFALVVDRGTDRVSRRLAGADDAAAGFELAADWRVRQGFDRARAVLGVAGMVVVIDALARMRPAYVAEFEARGERAIGWAVFHALWSPWPRLAAGCAAVGLLVWLSVLLEGEVLSRRAFRLPASGDTPSGS